MTSSGSPAYQLSFDAKAYQNSDAYKAQKEIDQMASGYVQDKKEQKQRISDQKAAIKAEKQRKIQANKPWYEKAGDLAGSRWSRSCYQYKAFGHETNRIWSDGSRWVYPVRRLGGTSDKGRQCCL
ncbi:hypothetical protein AMD01_20940 [Priestia koreensis]|uniref:Uncharacterized protein n=1 Tax=Priestia koreensis TaxID=284581 RepID=A0A0M0KNM5_9BACI|nr:hypothetical protein AMD01_20940 [Priestia koreensis]